MLRVGRAAAAGVDGGERGPESDRGRRTFYRPGLWSTADRHTVPLSRFLSPAQSGGSPGRGRQRSRLGGGIQSVSGPAARSLPPSDQPPPPPPAASRHLEPPSLNTAPSQLLTPAGLTHRRNYVTIRPD
ncbi:hypothetical protein NDU88_002768 [Pleurodeles waltl]|uniref:Uncharacterized protein n=1 Tax=Pleurodeles waltl TaxID=8319 RepID=A0AAV7W4B3_PLEWA|nr:hypothetical protein NDU88_002768 [Pleurodeles waltl]